MEDPTGAVQVDLTDAVSFVLLKDITKNNSCELKRIYGLGSFGLN